MMSPSMSAHLVILNASYASLPPTADNASQDTISSTGSATLPVFPLLSSPMQMRQDSVFRSVLQAPLAIM